MSGSNVGCSGPRTFNTICTNATTKPIYVSIKVSTNNSSGSWGTAWMSVQGVLVAQYSASESDKDAYGWLGSIIPPGATYWVSSAGPALIYVWSELR